MDDPTARRVLRDVEMQNTPAIVADDKETVEDAERDRRHCEEVHRRNRVPVILKQRAPTDRRDGDRQRLPQRRGSEADEGVRSAQLQSGEETEGAAELGGQTSRTASGVREPAAAAGRAPARV